MRGVHPEIERGTYQIAVYKVETAGYDAQERVKLMAAVPEASPPSHRSKRRADNADQANLEQVEKLKAAHNLDTSFDQGTSDQTAIPILHFTKEHIVDNLESIGIRLGSGELEISKTVAKINSPVIDSYVAPGVKDEISRIFDQEEKELAEEEEVDKLILNSLCSEIMDEVMNLDSAYPLDCKTILRKKSPW
jgi:hypothetical protein